MSGKSFYARWSLPILATALFLAPIIVYGTIRALGNNANDVRDWLPKDYPETVEYAWFKQHFGTEEFVIVERMTAGPARAFGLERPRIAVGAEADLALWDLRERYVVGESDLHSRSRNCAFLGREVQGRCLLALAGGRIAHTSAAGVAA